MAATEFRIDKPLPVKVSAAPKPEPPKPEQQKKKFHVVSNCDSGAVEFAGRPSRESRSCAVIGGGALYRTMRRRIFWTGIVSVLVFNPQRLHALEKTVKKINVFPPAVQLDSARDFQTIIVQAIVKIA